jgi:hypothetical protein
VTDASILPRNTEIEAALFARRRLVSGRAPRSRHRGAAPLGLAGDAAHGGFRTAPRRPGAFGYGSAHSDINLHLFTESPEAVSIRLEDQGIPHEVLERR